MPCAVSRRCLTQLLRDPIRSRSFPTFLHFAFSQLLRAQCFSTTSAAQSRASSAAISVLPEVSLKFIDLPQAKTHGRTKEIPKMAIEVNGPLGQMTLNIPPFMNVAYDGSLRKAAITVQDIAVAHQRAMQGTMRAHLKNHILGVSEGHIRILSLVGVGYRASIEPIATTVTPKYPGQQFVSLKVGYSHPIELGIPEGVKASTPQPTRILLSGIDKEVVTQFAAEIREWRKPEPYKGKGVFVNGESIRLKSKKIK